MNSVSFDQPLQIFLNLQLWQNKGFIEGKQTDVIYIDFSKVFAKVHNNLLVHKLNGFGFSSSLLNSSATSSQQISGKNKIAMKSFSKKSVVRSRL